MIVTTRKVKTPTTRMSQKKPTAKVSPSSPLLYHLYLIIAKCITCLIIILEYDLGYYEMINVELR